MRLHTLLGDYPVSHALRSGTLKSDLVQFDFADVKVPHTAFKRVVRDLEFDVAEIAIVTFLMAKAYGKPLRLLPAVMFGRFQHPYLVSTSEIKPEDLEGKRIAIRSSSVTTVMWLRGILAEDHGVNLDRVQWLQINHMVAVRRDLDPAVSDEVFSLLSKSKDQAGKVVPDTSPFGLEENRRNFEVAIDYVYRQRLILRRYTVDELFER